MIIRKILFASALSVGLVYPSVSTAGIFKKKKKEEKKDTIATESQYKKLTGKEKNTRQGLFNVYKSGDDYYFEIPDSLMGKDMLVVNRLVRVPKELNEAGVNRGVNYETQMVRFELDSDKKKVYLKQQRPLPVTPANDIISRSVADNFISPLIASFKAEAFNSDSTAVVIKVTDLYNGKETSVNNVFAKINLGTSAKSELSSIEGISVFDNNVVAKSLLTTKVTEGKESVFVTVEVSSSIVLLPEVPMSPRDDSDRIGYFTSDHLFFSDDQQKVDTKKYITRWRLEPKDKEAYLKGELVEPQKPIVFYIDGSVPERWRPYLEKGITDWNVAFEKAGFKNAIRAEFLPDSIEAKGDDINYSTLMYAASTKQNAMGPSTLDPRSGEILEADIMWWHNVMVMLQEWITVQTGAVCKDVRSVRLPDDIMGDAMRFVICHEVGHSLGLRHNMIGSWAVPVDSLRSKEWTDSHAYNASSIMDYARYNYAAQPGDNVTRLAPHIGPYDLLAIEYGYRWYGDEDDKTVKEKLNQLLAAHNGNMYKFSEAQSMRDAVDPRAQIEDLGDDAIKASELGIANLKIAAENVIQWTTTGEAGQGYEEASRLYYSIVNQWNYYLYHVMANIGGIYIENTTVGDGQKTFTYVPHDKQKNAMEFLLDNVLTFPKWLFANGLSDYTFLRKDTPLGVIERAPTQVLKNAQAYLLYDLLNNNRLMRMLENESVNGKKAYTAVEMMNDLHNHIFATTIKGGQPDVMTRNLQKLFVDALITAAAKEEGIKVNKKISSVYVCDEDDAEAFGFVGEERFLDIDSHACPWMDMERAGNKRELDFYGSQVNRTSDAISVKRGELLKIKDLLKARTSGAVEAVKYHYKDIIIRIDNALGI